MKRLAAAAIAILLAGCSPPSHIRKVHDVADIEALFRIDLCDKAKVVSEGSTPPLTSVKELLIDFPNTRCVEDFFGAMKRDGRGEDVLEGREYFRIIGGQEKPTTMFAVDRMGETGVILRLSGSSWDD